jgi:integrase
MARRGGLTVITAANLAAKRARYEVPDSACPGLHLVVHPSGKKSWAYRYRFSGKSRKLTVGTAFTEAGIAVIAIGDARDIADEARVSVARQIDPGEAKKAGKRRAAEEVATAANTLRAVAETYLDQPEYKRLRTIERRRDVFTRLINPKLGDKQIEGLKRSEIVAVLDQIAKASGPAMADFALATLRRVLHWYALRSDDYTNPIMRGMARTSTKERARSRTLSRIEMRALWRATGKAGVFGQYLRFTLLTATRRNESAHMRRSEIEGANWTIQAPRYKTKVDHLVPLSTAAVAVLSAVPKIGKGDVVFTMDGLKPITGFGCRKADFDRIMLSELRKVAGDDAHLPRWTLHDLRRTARTLMTEAGIPSDHAEACLGHVVKGVEGTYNRHSYRDEKRVAFEKLAELVARVVGDAP